MNKPALIQSIRQKFESVRSVLHERGRRIWAAAEARQIGWGGETFVEEATGITRKTIRRGMREIEMETVAELTTQRSRIQGAGRKNTEDIYPSIREELDALIDPVTRGDPPVLTTLGHFAGRAKAFDDLPTSCKNSKSTFR